MQETKNMCFFLFCFFALTFLVLLPLPWDGDLPSSDMWTLKGGSTLCPVKSAPGQLLMSGPGKAREFPECEFDEQKCENFYLNVRRK